MGNRQIRQFAPYPRARYKGGITRPIVPVGTVQKLTDAAPGTFKYVNGGQRALAYQGEDRLCLDVVTPNFRARANAGEVFNNPFTSAVCVCTQGGEGQVTEYTGAPPSPWRADVNWGLNVASTLRTYDARFLFGPCFTADGQLPATIAGNVDVARLKTRAHTSALAKVDEGVASTLVTIGELGETLRMLRNPLASLRDFLKRNTRMVKRLRSGLPSAPRPLTDVKDLANEYLAFYFGILPFCRDIESMLDAWIEEGCKRERETARSGDTDSYTSTTIQPYVPVVGASAYACKFTRKEEVEVRCGILYEPSVVTYQKVFGARLADLPNAAYQLLPWSFFVDYFLNIGKVIRALTPRPDVRYLASWETVRYTITERAECTGGGMGGTWIWTRGNTEWAERCFKVTVRNPVPVYANVGFSASLGKWEDPMKVAATICLAIQQLVR